MIEDGKGRGYRAAVTANNRLETLAIAESRAADISKREGTAFVVPSGFISLTTTGSFNGILYLKNTSATNDLFIDKIRTCSDTMGDVKAKLIRNPSTGTLISDANDAAKLSSNLGSNNLFEGDAFTASGDGKTITDGVAMSQFINHSPGHSIQEYSGSIVIPNGASLALVVQPSVAMTFCAEIQCWFEA